MTYAEESFLVWNMMTSCLFSRSFFYFSVEKARVISKDRLYLWFVKNTINLENLVVVFILLETKKKFRFFWLSMSSPLLINVNNVNGRGCTLLSIRKGCLGGRGSLPTIEKGYPISIISYILSWKSAQLRLTPLHSIIGIYILFTLLFTFPLVLTRRICLSIKAS